MTSDHELMCRLCFASEGSSTDVTYSPINPHLYFLNTLMRISLDKEKSQSVCSTCEFQIETAKLLRKRVAFTETVWNESKKVNVPNHCSKIADCDPDVLLNCHVCGHSDNNEGLKTHILTQHRSSHVSNCNICSVLVGSGDSPKPADDGPVPAIEEVFVSTQPSSCAGPSPKRAIEAAEDLNASKSKKGRTIKPTSTFCISSIPDAEDSSLKRFPCPACKYCPNRRDGLKRHIEVRHPEILVVKKKAMMGREKGPSYFAITTDRSKEKPFTCDTCGFTSKRIDGMKRHITNIHKSGDEDEFDYLNDSVSQSMECSNTEADESDQFKEEGNNRSFV